jgi:GNAT superfamily N-acetyltransferase
VSAVNWIERHLPERLRNADIAKALREIKSRIIDPDLRADTLWRINRLLLVDDEITLDSRPRRAAFSDIFEVFSWRKFRLKVRVAAVSDHANGQVVFVGNLRMYGQNAALIKRTLAVGDRWVEHDYFAVEPRFRNRGLAAGLLKTSFDYYDRIGIRVVIVHAALETGRHYWARVGFDFLRDEDRKRVDDWFQKVLTSFGLTYDTSTLGHANDYTTVSGLLPRQTASLSEICNAVGGLNRKKVEKIAEKNSVGMDEQLDLARAIMLTGPDWWGKLTLDPTSHDRRVFENFFQIRTQALRP